MRVYLSGPMSGLPDHNFPAFQAAREQLRSEGFDVLCPAEAGKVPGWTWEQYLKRDLAMVFLADAVVVLPGWEDSRGARLEVHVARELSLLVVPYDEHDLLWDLP